MSRSEISAFISGWNNNSVKVLKITFRPTNDNYQTLMQTLPSQKVEIKVGRKYFEKDIFEVRQVVNYFDKTYLK